MSVTGRRTALGRALGGAAMVAFFSGCSTPGDPVHRVDLAATFATAVRRPASGAFDVRPVQIDGESRLAIAVPAASRITWRMNLPDSARLQTWMAAESACPPTPGGAVDFRIGISDERTYEQLLVRTISATSTAAWQPATIDLAAYSGFHWSLFYRPREIAWTLVLNTRPIGATSAPCTPRPLWGAPAIDVSR